jgi:hypothetical protein
MKERICQFSPCRKYRYTLWREIPQFTSWLEDYDERANQYLMVIGLNPSTADETKDDPTIRRCVDFAKRWGYGALCMTNLFAWRDTKPANMKAAMFPVGGDNDMWLRECAADAGMILAAWGTHGSFLERGKTVASDMRNQGKTVYALRKNADGSPQHPLYIPADTQPILL